MYWSDEQVSEFVKGYVECATWADLQASDDLDAPWGSDPGEYGPDELEPESLAQVRSECAEFMAANAVDLESYCEQRAFDASHGTVLEYAGHDFYLTRRGHGAGFWDRDLGGLGDRLTAASEAYGDTGLVWLDSKSVVHFG